MNLVGLRAVKTPEELKIIRKAIAISDEAFMRHAHIKVGRAECDLAAELEYNMRKLGAAKLLLTPLWLQANGAHCPMG